MSIVTVKGCTAMRIDGKRSSEYTQDEILLMLFNGKTLNSEPLTDQQKIELAKVYSRRYDEERVITPYFNHCNKVLKDIHERKERKD